MLKAFPEPIRAIIKHGCELRWSIDAILTNPYNVSSRTLQKVRRSWNDFDTVFVPSENGSGRSNFGTGESDPCKENLASTGGRCYGQENVYVERIWVFHLLHCEH